MSFRISVETDTIIIYCFLVRSAFSKRCFVCEEERSPPIKEPACNQTTPSCNSQHYRCFAQVVKKANGNIQFSKGCISVDNVRCHSNPEACEPYLGKSCRTTCCSTNECNVSFPELNGGIGVVLGVMPMIVSIFFAFAFL